MTRRFFYTHCPRNVLLIKQNVVSYSMTLVKLQEYAQKKPLEFRGAFSLLAYSLSHQLIERE